VWWFSFLPDLEGVDSAFRVILGSLIAIRTRVLLARADSFFLAPLPGFLASIELSVLVCRFRKEEMVERGILVLRQMAEGPWPSSLRVKMRSFSHSVR
jgi:hypothetical protein